MKTQTRNSKRYLALVGVLGMLGMLTACNLPFKIVPNDMGEYQPQNEEYYQEPNPEEVFFQEPPPEGEPFQEPHPEEEQHEFGESPREMMMEFNTNRTHLAPGECAMLWWHVEGAGEAFLNGSPVGPAGEMEVCLNHSEHFMLEAGGQIREIEFIVEGGHAEEPPPPQPQPTSPPPNPTSPPAPNPTPTIKPILLPSADLALTDLYPDKLKNGTVYGRITNHGPDKVTNLQVNYSCSWAKTAYGATLGLNESSGSRKITIKSLNPGQTATFNTGIKVDLLQFWYNMTCTIQVPFANLNSNSGNDSYTEKLAK